MRDFPVENPPSLETASNLLFLRFEKLNFEQFSAALLPLDDTEFAERFHEIPRKMHHYHGGIHPASFLAFAEIR